MERLHFFLKAAALHSGHGKKKGMRSACWHVEPGSLVAPSALPSTSLTFGSQQGVLQWQIPSCPAVLHLCHYKLTSFRTAVAKRGSVGSGELRDQRFLALEDTRDSRGM